MAELHDRIRDFWDEDARTYDRAPSHAVTDPTEAAAWREALRASLPDPPSKVLDVGAGTGAISLLAAELGHHVTALDISPGMLDRARAKAVARGHDISFVVGPSTEPPPGPFDAVVERHVLWTTPDPAAALGAWRRVAPGGRLVVLEGVWGRSDLVQRARDAAASLLQRAHRVPRDHHAEYEADVLSELPLARMPSPGPLIEAVYGAGWKAVRIRRLIEVEWARRMLAPLGLGWLESIPQYVLVADA